MNEPKEVHVGSAFNQIITITELVSGVAAVVNLSAATTKTISFKSPDGEAKDDIAASFVTDGTDGKIQATVTAAMNNVVGTAYVQAYVVIATLPYYSDVGSVEVLPNLS